VDTQSTNDTKETKDETAAKRYERLAQQVSDEIKAAEAYQQPWRATKRTFLKLYINQRKNQKKVGDTLMFSTHQTILAALYKDRQDAEWLWREEEDMDRADQLNALYAFDYDEQDKAAHDYGKLWDSCFFGVALEDWSYFDRDSLTPIPILWDPLATLVDPSATTINGDRLGNGAARHFGREITRTKQEMQDDKDGRFINIDKLKVDDKRTSEQQQNDQARDAARGMGARNFAKANANELFSLYQWFTRFEGKRLLVEISSNRQTIVREVALKQDYWPVVDHRIYPEPHTFWTPGCTDFVEDKQRARAILQNYTLDAAKFDVLPEWLFDKNKIKNKKQLATHKAGKFIEGEGIDANTIMPLQKPTIHQYSQGIMQEMETNAQKALATPEIQQGILFAQKRTATEINETSTNVDTRYSLTANLFSLSDANGAYMWLDSYKRNFKKGIDKKTIRVIGAFGPKPMPITPDTFKFKKDPDVRLESRYVSQARKKQEQNNLIAFGNILAQTQGSNMRFFAKQFGRLSFSKDEVDRLIPPTIDEMRAEKENESLNENTLKGVVIEPMDDHTVHLEIHGKAAETKAKAAHIEAHKKAMMLQRNNPALFAPPSPPGAAGGPLGPTSPTPTAPFNNVPEKAQQIVKQLTGR
jgi:hypothetical protein